MRGATPQATFTRLPATLPSRAQRRLTWPGTNTAAARTSPAAGSIGRLRLSRRLEPATAQRTRPSCRDDATELTDTVRSGYCYRWVLTLTDAAGNQSTAYSGAVLVDSSAPRAPIVRPTGDPPTCPIWPRWVSARHTSTSTGRVWVRGGVSGSVALQVSGSDPRIRRSSATSRTSPAAAGTRDWAGTRPMARCASVTRRQSAPVNGRGQQRQRRRRGRTIDDRVACRDGSAPTAPAWVTRSDRHDEEHPRLLFQARIGRPSATPDQVSSGSRSSGVTGPDSMPTARAARTVSPPMAASAWRRTTRGTAGSSRTAAMSGRYAASTTSATPRPRSSRAT